MALDVAAVGIDFLAAVGADVQVSGVFGIVAKASAQGESALSRGFVGLGLLG